MNKKKLIMISIFAVGISLLLYPRIGNFISSYNQKKSIKQYISTVEVMDEKNNQELYDQAVKYNEKIQEYKKSKNRFTLDEDYKNVLKLNETGIMGYIQIPKVSIELPIYHSVEENVLQKGVGHVKESSLPIGSVTQNSVLMGHSGLPISKIFTNLERLNVDDYIVINILNRSLYYKIIHTEVVEPSEVIDKLAIEEGKDLITLVTCTPYGINSHRLIIRAERTEEVPPDLFEKVKEQEDDDYTLIFIIINALALITIGLGVTLYRKKKLGNAKGVNSKRLKKKNKKKKKVPSKRAIKKKTSRAKKKKKTLKKKKKTTKKKKIEKKTNIKRGKKNVKES